MMQNVNTDFYNTTILYRTADFMNVILWTHKLNKLQLLKHYPF